MLDPELWLRPAAGDYVERAISENVNDSLWIDALHPSIGYEIFPYFQDGSNIYSSEDKITIGMTVDLDGESTEYTHKSLANPAIGTGRTTQFLMSGKVEKLISSWDPN